MELSVSLDLHWGEKLFFPQSPRTIASEGYCFWFLLQSDPTFFLKKKKIIMENFMYKHKWRR